MSGVQAKDEFSRFDVLGVPVCAINLKMAYAALVSWSEDNAGRHVTVPDVSNIVRAQDDRELMAIHRSAAMVCPDGMPLVWLGKLAGKDVDRTCGPDLIDYAMAQSGQRIKHFLYGGKPGVAEALKESFKQRYPEVQIVRASAPPFRPLTKEELSALVSEINESGAHLLWLGLSTPKQEYLMGELAGKTSATVIGVGAAFDFHSGAIKRAPRWMQRSGLECVHRFATEPRRLWRRYIIMAPRFLFMLATKPVTPLR